MARAVLASNEPRLLLIDDLQWCDAETLEWLRYLMHVDLGKRRLETLCLLITGMIGARTVNLSHLASERQGEVLVASTYRRLQRFFQHVRLGEDWAARLIVRHQQGSVSLLIPTREVAPRGARHRWMRSMTPRRPPRRP